MGLPGLSPADFTPVRTSEEGLTIAKSGKNEETRNASFDNQHNKLLSFAQRNATFLYALFFPGFLCRTEGEITKKLF